MATLVLQKKIGHVALSLDVPFVATNHDRPGTPEARELTSDDVLDED